MIAIIDYGVGNLFSLSASLRYIGKDVKITNKKEDLKEAERIILPGVGAFGDARKKLEKTGLIETIKEETQNGKPMLGICLGMQLLFEKGFEYGEHEGLGLVKGDVVTMDGVVPDEFKIPHIGWNKLIFPKGKEKSPIFKYINEGDYVYFVHSFYGSNCEEALIASTEYGASLTAAVSNGKVFGTQFHPEKSGKVGLKILEGFCEV